MARIGIMSSPSELYSGGGGGKKDKKDKKEKKIRISDICWGKRKNSNWFK